VRSGGEKFVVPLPFVPAPVYLPKNARYIERQTKKDVMPSLSASRSSCR
jgi:hypothetical protein